MNRILLLLFLGIFISKINAQEYIPNNESVQNKNNNYAVFTSAKIYVTPTQIIEKGSLLIQNGKVIGAGTNLTIPKNCTTINLEGKSIYPSFIDIYIDFRIEKPKNVTASSGGLVYDTKREGFYWNENIRPEVNAYENFKYDQTKAIELLKVGFAIVGTHVQDGIARGTGTLIALNNSDKCVRLLSNKITNHFGFTRSVATNQDYPSSLMRMMALLRQMYLDQNWYKNGNSKTKDLSLEALRDWHKKQNRH